MTVIVREAGRRDASGQPPALWTASGWLDPDKVLDLVAVAAIGRGWSEVPASELFAELLPEPEPGPMDDESEEPPQP